MANKIIWHGASGQSYEYEVYTLSTTFKKLDGNYIFVRQSGSTSYAVYIGEGNLKDRISPAHHKWDCIHEKGATHVHVHLNADERSRKAEERDLLNEHTEAYDPTGCNE